MGSPAALRIASIVALALAARADGRSADSPPALWSLRPLSRPAPPAVRDGAWPRGEIDRFILARLEAEGLAPSPEADRRTLIRRVTLDLHGLPPTPEEIDAFIADERSDAYERLVERLLASPRYGERWALHWLDAARFAETNGFEMNQPRESAWRYRDYVIRALNEDRPYPRFVREQLAGDVPDAAGRVEDTATGFLVGGPWDQVKSPDIVLTREQRSNELHDMVSTTGSLFLGLTVGCARCHDHKFDPILQREYYALQAIFAGVQHGERELRGAEGALHEGELRVAREEIERIDGRLAALEPLADPSPPAGAAPRRVPVSPLRNLERFAAVEASAVRFTVLETAGNGEPCLDELEVLAADPAAGNLALASRGARARASSLLPGFAIHRVEHLNDGQFGNGRSWISAEAGTGWAEIELPAPARIDRVVWGRDREGKFRDRLPIRYRLEVRTVSDGVWRAVASSEDRAPDWEASGAAAAPALTLSAEARALTERRALLEKEIVRLGAKSQVYAGVFSEPEPTHLLRRGDAMQPAEEVPPGGLACLRPPLEIPSKAMERERRAALARWIGDRANPLSPRVMVNRLWLHHFGEGLVSTPSDFGRNGAAPSHPELLDWLASEFIAEGWSLKTLHRRIVLSSAYRQSSRPRSECLARDAACRLLWRFPPRRLEAEAIRDSILSASGKLDLTAGGPGFSPFVPNENYVRVYEPKQSFGPDDFRRMVYQTKVRSREDGTFGAFDCPDGGQVCPKRPRSTTPLQALNLLNSSFVMEQAKFFAARLESDAPGDRPAQVRLAFRISFGRDPENDEARAALELISGSGLPLLCRSLLNANEFLFLE